MIRKIGLITIGQSPRIDMTPEMETFIGADTKFIEIGALDDLTFEEIQKLSPTEGEPTYVSRLRSGDYAKLSKERLLPLLQEKILKIEKEVSSSILVCTGSFPSLTHNKPLLFPDQILHGVVKGIIGDNTLGVIIPLPEQEEILKAKWQEFPLVIGDANPYVKNVDLITPSMHLKEQGATIIVLDCMGYTEEHKESVQKAIGLPVILSRSIVSRVAAEMA